MNHKTEHFERLKSSREIDEVATEFAYRESLRRSALKSMIRQGNRMRTQAAKSQGSSSELEKGTICLINMNEYDRAKGDSTFLTTVIVEKPDRGFCRLV